MQRGYHCVLWCNRFYCPSPAIRHNAKGNPAIGKNFTDHLILSLEFELNHNILSHHQIHEDPDKAAAAEKAYSFGKKGDLVKFGGSSGVLFPKFEKIYKSKEFTDIADEETKKFLLDPGRPSTEIWFMVLLHFS
jgi:hypothetical protein